MPPKAALLPVSPEGFIRAFYRSFVLVFFSFTLSTIFTPSQVLHFLFFDGFYDRIRDVFSSKISYCSFYALYRIASHGQPS